MKPNEKVLKPFFAQFLESQMKAEEEKKRQAAGVWTSKLADAPDQTHKYPSDGDEEWWLL